MRNDLGCFEIFCESGKIGAGRGESGDGSQEGARAPLKDVLLQHPATTLHATLSMIFYLVFVLL